MAGPAAGGAARGDVVNADEMIAAGIGKVRYEGDEGYARLARPADGSQHLRRIDALPVQAQKLAEPHAEDRLDAARRENEAAMAELIRCRESDTWPTGFESMRQFDRV